MGGESNADCHKRAIKVFKELLSTYRRQQVVFGTQSAINSFPEIDYKGEPCEFIKYTSLYLIFNI